MSSTVDFYYFSLTKLKRVSCCWISLSSNFQSYFLGDFGCMLWSWKVSVFIALLSLNHQVRGWPAVGGVSCHWLCVLMYYLVTECENLPPPVVLEVSRASLVEFLVRGIVAKPETGQFFHCNCRPGLPSLLKAAVTESMGSRKSNFFLDVSVCGLYLLWALLSEELIVGYGGYWFGSHVLECKDGILQA